MKQIIALLLTLSVMVIAIACGGPAENTSQNDSQNNTQSDVQNNVQDDSLDEDVQDDAGNEQEDSENAQDDTQDAQDDADQDPQEGEADKDVRASHSDVTLKAAGNSFTLKAEGLSGSYTATYTSADPAIATVSDKGLVTAVTPGTTTVSLHVEGDGGSYDFSCIVRCTWKTENAGSDTGAGDDSAAGSVDLTAFYNDMTSQYEFGSLQAFTGDVLESYYPGMGAVSTKQCLVMGTMMTMNNGEFCLVEVSDSKDSEKDVEIVKSIFQSRIDYMVNGGAWYPEPTEIWTNNSRVVSNGNYVMMVVNPDCDAIVTAFNGLFA